MNTQNSVEIVALLRSLIDEQQMSEADAIMRAVETCGLTALQVVEYWQAHTAAQHAVEATRIPVEYKKTEHAVSVDRYLDALRTVKDRVTIFATDGRLVDLADHKYRAKVWVRDDAGTKIAVEKEHTIFGTSPLTITALDDVISRHIESTQYDGKAKKPVEVGVPPKVAPTIIGRSTSAHSFRRLNGVIGCPSLRPDGSLMVRQGHDIDTGYYLACDVSALCEIETHHKMMLDNPDEGQARAMLRHVRQLLGGFPFHDAGEDESTGITRRLYEVDPDKVTLSESVALAGLMTSVCRSMFDVVPGFCISANGYGIGKTFLSEIFGFVVTGRQLPSYFWSTNNEENDKLLATLLLQGIAFGILDNINGRLMNTLLAQWLSSPRPEPRQLGSNTTIQVRQWATLFMNGVNLAPSDDLERRLLYCDMMTDTERPQDRTFKFNPMTSVQQNRGQYLLAVLTIMRWHMTTGGQLPSHIRPLAGFEDWSHAVVGALVRLGCPNPIKSQARIRDKSASANADVSLFKAIREAFKEKGATTTELRAHAVAHTGGELFTALMALGWDKGVLPSVMSIGKHLGNKANMITGGLKLCCHKNRVNQQEWRVEVVDAIKDA
ncbi:hypothetical protein [Mesorhizobium sp. B4-1-4]|uniref:hypothetical protein n=1 Tax=Mesorhizobium sp. B4-1-4 TaxID=2589888 RepID=UPI00112DE356|nr:hypothetical protein [Mesorhizobium sp. B4-1-4]UCI32526.1 hypothetical protein FJW03_03465 [Mesorhizobium sp. B4-1-4]